MPDAVVDIGNSRIKFCRVVGGKLALPVRGMAVDDLAAWERLATEWDFGPGQVWAVAASNAGVRDQFAAWVQSRGETAVVIDAPRKVPIGVSVDEPDKVGVDRLLNAVAVRSIHPAGQPAIIVSAGSAVTVDLLHEQGSFAGGTIFPGLRLMALALHEHTAALPLVDATADKPDGPPGKNTVSAMQLGILHAVAGGIDAVIRETVSRCTSAPHLYLTGGDMTPRLGGLLQSRHQFRSEVRPALTLEGILLTAEYLA